MNDIFKQSDQSSNTTRASFLKSNQPLRRTNLGQKNLSYIAPNIWNKLPDSLKVTENLTT